MCIHPYIEKREITIKQNIKTKLLISLFLFTSYDIIQVDIIVHIINTYKNRNKVKRNKHKKVSYSST